MPASTCRRTSRRIAASSSERSARNGVTNAVPHPLHTLLLLANPLPIIRPRFTISRNSNQPFFPTTQRAACKAPRAKPSRLRAVCRSVMVSAAESNPISCVPGCAPARFELTSTRRDRAALLHLLDHLEQRAAGRIFLRGVVNLPGPRAIFRIAAPAAARPRPPDAENTFTPIEKFGTPHQADAALLDRRAGARRCRSSHPVVPTTTFTPIAASRSIFSTTAAGTENSTATSMPRKFSAVMPAPFALSSMSSRSGTSKPYSGASCSTRRPIFPYPTIARFDSCPPPRAFGGQKLLTIRCRSPTASASSLFAIRSSLVCAT